MFDFRGALGAFVAIGLLAACGGSQPQLRVQGPQTATSASSKGRSLMKETSSGQDLLYVVDQQGQNVHVYTYPQGGTVGTLTGFIYPAGECVDLSGDVFIVSQARTGSYFSSTIYEYAHGGTAPIATLNDPVGGAGCAIDPKTGNLAVAGAYFSSPYAYGAVAIFKKAQGSPKMYSSKLQGRFFLCGYDPQGNLYISSANSATPGVQQLIRLAKGSSNFEQIALASPMYGDTTFPSSVQWDGTYMTVSAANANYGSGRYQPSYIYRLKISGDAATTVSTTTYTGKRKLMTGQVWIDGSHIIASHYHAGGGVDFWLYPNAGKATAIVPTSSGVSPWGIAVSPGTGR